MKVCLVDPALDNDINFGDHVISRSVRSVLKERCELNFSVALPSVRRLAKDELASMMSCDLVVVGGTNLLSSNMLFYRQWKLSISEFSRLRNVVLMGVGWWQYQGAPGLLTRRLLRKMLHKDYLHSVRDEYTRRKLLSIGIENVVNTSCPSLWDLTDESFKDVPCRKAQSVVFTLTCYNKVPRYDFELYRTLKSNYERVYFWPQGNYDRVYAEGLGLEVEFLDDGLDSFDRLLDDCPELDYVGTRLHGGVHALRRGRRALILGVDNRAVEIGKDIFLQVIDRSDMHAIGRWIGGSESVRLSLPRENIDRWVAQFSRLSSPPLEMPVKTA